MGRHPTSRKHCERLRIDHVWITSRASMWLEEFHIVFHCIYSICDLWDWIQFVEAWPDEASPGLPPKIGVFSFLLRFGGMMAK